MTQELPRDERGRFPKGVSGNPEGRPPGRGRSLSQLKRAYVNEADPDDPEGRTRGGVLLEQLYFKGRGGDVSAIRELLDRVDGKPRQPVTLTLDTREKYERMVDDLIQTAASGRTPRSRRRPSPW